MDFIDYKTKWVPKNNIRTLYPAFKIKKSEDLMIRGGDFYAFWDEESGLWCTDEIKLIEKIDRELYAIADNSKEDPIPLDVMALKNSDNGMIDKWHKYVQKQMRDNYVELDKKIIFSNTETNKKDYATKKLPYSMEKGAHPAYDELISVLYNPEERHKIEWAIGSVITGESKEIQKFIVLYGTAGSGKSTVINIIQLLFDGYYNTFSTEALGSRSDSFSLEPFKTNPLVAIEHDGDLSRIETNTRLNSIVSHEEMIINEKHKSLYTAKFNAMLFVGTNKPVRITDSKSGILRRLIDVSPTGNKVSLTKYNQLTSQIKFELGAIAWHCKEVYEKDKYAYNGYVPNTMLGATNDLYNFLEEKFDDYFKQNIVTLGEAWQAYKVFCEEANVQFPLTRRVFREELKAYFKEFIDRKRIDGLLVRSVYEGFRAEKFGHVVENKIEEPTSWLKFNRTRSLFDKLYGDNLAQYASKKYGTPKTEWDNVTTKLSDLNTKELHYVRVPINHIVIDFDLKNSDGEKDYKKNLEAASKWPETYAELSKSGQGIHLHYIYDGDVTMLSRLYDEEIEVKVFTGKSSLRRMLTKCNDKEIATLKSGLPLKGEKRVVNFEAIKSERGLRTIIKNCLEKKHHGATKPEVDYIYDQLTKAYDSGLHYDVSDMRQAILNFAMGSTHQADYCVKLLKKMPFKSEEPSIPIEAEKDTIIFYDVEVFPNLFVIVWKAMGESKQPVKMINPSPASVEELVKYKLVGFNCRRYDNHILYARMMGYTNEQLYNLSQKIINHKKDDPNPFFSQAYNISFTDIYDYSTKKQSLKKWEIELKIHHQELGLPWDQPVSEDKWDLVADYCINDVIATEAVWNATKEDWKARQILADLADGDVNMSTNTLILRILFGNEKKPTLVYTDLATGEQWEGR